MVAVTAGLRERKKEKTRDALARSALRLFAKRGFDNVTVEEIAASCEVSPRTFFRYFASKEDVLFAESDAHRRRLLDALADHESGEAPFTVLESALRVVAADYASERDTLCARHDIVRSTPSLRSRVSERQQGWEAEVVDQLRATSARARRMSDLELRLVVASATSALRVAVEAWIAVDGDGDGRDLEDLLDKAFRRLRAGFSS
jgi:AcrR family transcriptional regulator